MADVDESDTAVSPRPSSGLPLPSASIHQVTPAHSAHASGDQALESHAEEDASAAIRILVATDNHIGYAEKDPVRGRDSINTFREILSIAIKEDVDMLLLAGDLFHENRPSRDSLYLTIAALREICLNRRPISLEIVSDAGMGIGTPFNFPQVNYEDENYNIGLPVFSIHGNHDDPQGVGPDGALCALDILSASGLINYFGRQDLPGAAQDDEEAIDQGIHIRPVLLQKGRTKLALYGIGNIRDERFHYELRSNHISMFRPAEDKESWFNVMLVHQNRVAHGPKNSVPDNGFGDEVDLVIWGHEHDCHIEAEEVPGKNYYISQPGSSIATSLAKGESLKKHVGLLEIQDRDFSLTPIPLKTVRPFIFKEIVLADEEEEHNLKLDDKKKVTKFLKEEVHRLIKQAKEEWEDLHADDAEPVSEMKPLIRLRVEYTKPDGETGYEVGNPQRFGQEFMKDVANPKDVVQFYRKKRASTRKKKNDIDMPEDVMDVDPDGELPEKLEKVQVSTLVHQYLEAQNLDILAETGLQRAVTVFVDKDDKDAIKEFHIEALKSVREQLSKEKVIDEDHLEEQVTRAKERFAVAWEKDNEVRAPAKKSRGKKAVARNSDDEQSDASTDFGRMSRGGSSVGSSAGRSKGKGKSNGKGSAKGLFNDDDDDSDSSIGVVPTKAAKKAAPAKKAPAKASAKKAPTKGQTTLDFAPARGSPSRAAASKAKKKMADGSDEAEEDDRDDAFEDDDSEEEARPKKKTATRRR